jgi:hypothetical protein
MLAGGAEELASSQSWGALDMLTAIKAVEFQAAVEWIQSIHRFLRSFFGFYWVMRKTEAKSIKENYGWSRILLTS